jgi:hypothetical protein
MVAGIGSLLLAGLGRWWEQVQSVDGAIAAVLFLLAFLNRPLLSYLEKQREKHVKRLPLKFPVAALILWIGWHVLAAAHTRITAAESEASTLKNRPAPAPVTIPVDPNPQLAAKIAEQEGTITRLTSENRDLRRDIVALRDTVEGFRAQLREQSAAADDRKKRATVRQQLATYMDGGRKLLNKYIASDAAPEIEKQLNQWYSESLKYINDQMGADYAAQYRQTTSSGMGINGFPVAKMGVVDAVNSRLRHLNTFIDSLR